AENTITIAEPLQRQADEWGSQSKTVIWFANSKEALSVVAISDKIKETSVQAIKEIQDMGIDLYMLTGDNEATAKAISSQKAIKDYKAEVLTHNKDEYVKDLQQQGKVVAIVGDGINDTTAVTTDNVSIAMSIVSDIATDVNKMNSISS